MPIQFKHLRAEDEILLWEYLYHALFVPLGTPPPAYEIIKNPCLSRYVENWGRQRGDLGFLAVDCQSNNDVGAVWLRLWPNDEKGYGFVDNEIPELSMAVRPEYRKKGIGTLLLRKVFAQASTRYSAVSLSVSDMNPAIRLYKRCGFKLLATSGGSSTMVRYHTK